MNAECMQCGDAPHAGQCIPPTGRANMREIRQLITRAERDELVERGWQELEAVNTPDGTRYVVGFPEQGYIDMERRA